jgi:hypothetical protein
MHARERMASSSARSSVSTPWKVDTVGETKRQVVGQPHDASNGTAAVHAANMVQDVGGLQAHPERRQVTVHHVYLRVQAAYQPDVQW